MGNFCHFRAVISFFVLTTLVHPSIWFLYSVDRISSFLEIQMDTMCNKLIYPLSLCTRDRNYSPRASPHYWTCHSGGLSWDIYHNLSQTTYTGNILSQVNQINLNKLEINWLLQSGVFQFQKIVITSFQKRNKIMKYYF